ncbi:reverse transcriptase domain-containing protein [Tanacetum coccineum]
MTSHHNHWDTSVTRDETSKNISSTSTTESPEVVRQLEMMNKNFVEMMRQIQTVKTVDTKCETCGGPHSFTECPAVGGYTQEAVYATTGNYNSGGNSYQPQGDRNLLSYRSNNYLGPPGFNQPNVQNNQNRYNQNQNQGNFQAPNYQAPNNQGRGQNFNQGNNNYQAPNLQAPNYQAQVGPSNELTSYMKSNEAILRDMRTQMTNMKTELRNEFKSTIDARTNKIENQNNQMMTQNNELKNMMANFFQMQHQNQNQSTSGSGSLPSNTVANPRGDLKAITTRSGVAYDGPTILPTSSSLPKVVEREIEEKLTTSTIKIGRMIYFLCQVRILMHIFLGTCLALADLGASINLMPLSVWKKLFLPDLTSTRMTLELADRTITRPKGVAEDVFVKVGKFHLLRLSDPVEGVPPYSRRKPFLRTERALIDVYGEEIILRYNDEAITFNVGLTSSHSYRYDDASVNRINVIDVTCEEYAQEVLGFSGRSSSGNPTPTNPIITYPSSSFTPFEGGGFILEEIKTFLHTPDELSNLDDDYYDTEGDILYLEKLLNEDPLRLSLR